MDTLTHTLTTVFGIPSFRPAQREVVEDILKGRDVVCVMPTGAGKSLCFQLPAVIQGGLTIIISPLISLMADQAAHLRRMKIPAMVLNSSQSSDEQRRTLAELHRGFAGLLYIAPERFNAPSFQTLLPKLKPALFAVDEAHCISSWGHDFRPEYSKLGEIRRKLGSPRTIALTATATPQVRDDIVTQLGLNSPQVHITGFDRQNLHYSAMRFAEAAQKDSELLRFLRTAKGTGIVYCSTRRHVEELTALLESKLHERPVFAYHAGMDQAARTSSQTRFMQLPDAIVVATNAFGMGINRPDIRFVLHYSTPGSIEAYYQEAGRAGRDGQPAECVLFYCAADRRTQEFFINKIGENNPALNERAIARLQAHAQQKLSAMMRYAQQATCRRRAILDYFGDRTSTVTGCTCDNCGVTQTSRVVIPAGDNGQQKRPEIREQLRRKSEPERAAQSSVAISFENADFLIPALSAVIQVEGVGDFGVTTVADILAGSRSARLQKHGLDTLPCYAELRPLRSEDIALALREMVTAGLLVQKQSDSYFSRPVVKITSHGIATLGRLKAQRTVEQTIARARTVPVTNERTRASAPQPSTASDHDATFERLRSWRSQKAQANKVPAFCILHDSVLTEICRSAPRDRMDLAAIKGIGSAKLEQFGDEILSIVNTR